jgi:hypothetical protein
MRIKILISKTNFHHLKTDYKNSNKTTLGIANKLDYSPNIKEKWFYNIQLQASNNNGKNSINSTTTSNNTLFETISNSDNSSLKQYIEWHKSYNDNHTNTLVVNHAFEKTLLQLVGLPISFFVGLYTIANRFSISFRTN